jgi:hypothetical protein
MVGPSFSPFTKFSYVVQEPSHRIVPANPPKVASIKDTANSFGLHDTLQYGPRSISTELKSGDSLKQRLESVSPVCKYAYSRSYCT